jgi:hypothetical protein
MIRAFVINETDHIILPHGEDRMVLGDMVPGPESQAIIVANRSPAGWLVTSPWTDTGDVTAGDRNSAIDAMIDMALTVLPGAGYGTFVPDYETPAGPVSLRYLS